MVNCKECGYDFGGWSREECFNLDWEYCPCCAEPLPKLKEPKTTHNKEKKEDEN